MAIILRTVKGTSLTYDEMDENLSQFSYSGSVSKSANQHTLYLHYTGSSGLGYIPRSESIDITPFPFEGTAQITGSLNVTGSFYYNGSLLEDLISGSGGSLTATSSVYTSYFFNALVHNVNHNFGTQDVVVSVYNNSNVQIIPKEVRVLDGNTVRVSFSQLTTGRAIVVAAGASGSISGSTDIVPDLGIYTFLTGSSTAVGLDTGSSHFQDAAYTYGIFRETGSISGSVWNTTNALGITGSLVITANSNQDLLSFDVSGSTQLRVDDRGILVMTSQSLIPTASAGGMYFGSDNNYYLGFY